MTLFSPLSNEYIILVELKATTTFVLSFSYVIQLLLWLGHVGH